MGPRVGDARRLCLRLRGLRREALRDEAGADGQFVWDVSRVYHDFHLSSEGLDGIYVHDSSAVAFLVRPDLYTVRGGPVRVPRLRLPG